MQMVQFLVGGTSITKIGRLAARLHHGQPPFVLECPQDIIPSLAGRRMFMVMYGDGRGIDKDDVEIIRRDLEKGLNTKAWSATFDDNGRITWYPQQTGPDQLPGARGNMYEDDPSPGDYAGGNWDEDFFGDMDEDDDGDLDEDWNYGFPGFPPPPHGRGNAYANGYEQSDRYRHTPDPFPRPGRQGHLNMNGFGHGDRYPHSPWPFPRNGRQRNSFPNDFGPSERYPHSPWPFPPRDGPRNPFTNNFDPRGTYPPTPEPTMRRNNRRNSYANNCDRDFQYEDFSPRGTNNNRRRHTFGPEDDVHGRFQQPWGPPPTSPHPRNGDHLTRNEVRERGEIVRSRGFRDSPEIGGRTQRGSKRGRFWRVVRSFFGHTT